MENIGLGLSTTGLGMLIVFLGLVFLMFIMLGLAGFSKAGGRKPSAPAEIVQDTAPSMVESATATVLEPVLPVMQTARQQALGTSVEEIAAISAVMAILMSEGISGQVTAVRPLGAKINTWALAGRRDLMASRL
ncbi:MAG TPA: OadG family protein [Bacillota bacterium]|nr:OadG family protein [Bacillota bacterium]HOH09422.1 OadG family protein [Bacillota bacterium]HOS50680.1 OadG family protein [Bacillota bacterium]HPI00997.1 OadG family protein [Bacillota bacterium]HPM64512.1 OadG family protein [Bacillota bacterium]